MQVRFHNSVESIGRDNWNTANGSDDPFVSYDFLFALENAADILPLRPEGSDATLRRFIACCPNSGWQPQHAVLYQNDKPVALMPSYIKHHSYGEYIFDWAWADAYHRRQMEYYPKLCSAIPFSPVTGDRILTNDWAESLNILSGAVDSIIEHCISRNLSSFHLLYPENALSDKLADYSLTQRHSFQYHWFNQKIDGSKFNDFDDFLGALKSRKRKDIRKERVQVKTQGVQFLQLTGDAIEPPHWDAFYRFYQLTYARRSGHGGYLPKAFFEYIGKALAEQILLVLAVKNGAIIAGALNLFSSSTLYGRYWGCTENAEFLHFETCYYQGIEFCIKNQLQKFDAGAQGEHKIQRGFRPVSTWSNHWIADSQFRQAINRYIEEEKAQNLVYMQRAEQMLPYKGGQLNA